MKNFDLKKLHYFSGVTLCLFIFAHLGNHLSVFFGADFHIEIMDSLRAIYRNPIVESLLLLAVAVQLFSGLKLWRKLRLEEKKSFAEKYQILSGLYLAFFLLIHVSAVLSGRFVFGLDTNLYFGAAGLNIFPLYLFFVPYYLLSIISIFTHIACIHFRKTDSALGAKIIFIIGVFMAIAIVYGMTGLKIPPEYYTPYGM